MQSIYTTGYLLKKIRFASLFKNITVMPYMGIEELNVQPWNYKSSNLSRKMLKRLFF